MNIPVESRIHALLQHLGLSRVHLAARSPLDWQAFLPLASDVVASLTLVCPWQFDEALLLGLGPRRLLITGDTGPAFEQALAIQSASPSGTHVRLPNYRGLLWDDAALDHGEAITAAILKHVQAAGALPPARLPATTGEHAGIYYRIEGQGPPLLLFPLGLAPSQWEPIHDTLAAHCCTITLSGPELGTLAMLESRSSAGYLRVARHVLDEIRLNPGERVFEAGYGTGALLRWLARHTDGATALTGIDLSPYMRREASAMAAHEGLAGRITYEQGDVARLPYADHSFDVGLACTLFEEVDAAATLKELIRVTRPDGRIGIIVRAIDMPWWVNVRLDPALKAVIEASSRLGAGKSPKGCADAGLYALMRSAGLADLRMMPQFATYTQGPFLQTLRAKLLLNHTPEDTERCRAAIAQADAEGTFFIAEPYHCAVGTVTA